jgi:hypothetical protein
MDCRKKHLSIFPYGIQQAVWHKWRCKLAKTFVRIFKLISRPNNSKPPPTPSRQTELGTMRVSFGSEGVENEKDFNANRISSVKIVFTPGVELKKQLADIHFELTNKGVNRQAVHPFLMYFR